GDAPLLRGLTRRPPEALRPKVMTGVITMALLAGPIGLLVVGPLLASWGPRPGALFVARGGVLAFLPFRFLGPRPVLLFVAVGQFLASLPFAFVALRRERTPPVTLDTA